MRSTLFACAWACAACASNSVAQPPPSTLQIATASAAAVAPVATAVPRVCGPKPQQIGRVDDVALNEISGVAESRKDSRVLFVHNDSGDSPRFFALARTGQVLAELVLDTVPLLIDAEDIAIGKGPGSGSFIYLGDTGNNFASFGMGIPRRKATLYRIPEPDIPYGSVPVKLHITEAFPIWLSFPDGARDVEAFFIDPRSGDLVMISKQPDGRSQILGASAALLAAGGGQLSLLGTLRFGQPPLPGNPMPTAASISRDGSAILVRTYSSVFLFRRAPNETVASALSRAPVELASPQERQGEAIGFVDQDAAFVTISEGVKPGINCATAAPQ